MAHNDSFEDRSPEIVIRKPLCWADEGSTTPDVCIERVAPGELNIVTVVGGQAANTVYAGPVSGPNSNPSFRVLVPQDVPGFAIPSAAQTSPTSAGTNTCAGNPAGWAQNAAGIFQTQFGIDTTWTVNGDTTFPGGLVSCRPMLFNSTGTANPVGGRNGHAFNVYDKFSAAPDHHFAVQYYYENSVSDSATYTTPNLGMMYGDFEINGTPTLNTTFVSTLRFRNDDNKTGGGKPRVWSVYQGETNKTAVYDITNCGGVGVDGFAAGAPCYSVFYAEQGATLSGNEDETGAIYDVYSGGTKDLGAHALNATGNVFHALVQTSTGNRFVNSNGFVSEDFGTAAGYYDLFLKGVNSAGTASGFAAAVGPFSFGTGVHAATGYQVDILGRAKFKAGAGVDNLTLFGSTSGQAGISVAAAAGTPNTVLLPTATGSSGQVLSTNGANPQQTSWITPNAGTVTSVALSLPAIISVSGSPVTTSGTLTGTLATQTANTVFAGPTSGGAAAPTFRALVAADLPTSLTVRSARTTSTCSTGSSSFDTCDTTLTWSSSFGDTNYSATCSGVGPVDGGNPTTGRVNLQIVSKTATQVTARTVTLGATSVSWTEIDCVGLHD